jgi:hypothetical protein
VVADPQSVDGAAFPALLTNVIHRSADSKNNYAPYFKNTIAIDRMNYYSRYTRSVYNDRVFKRKSIVFEICRSMYDICYCVG